MHRAHLYRLLDCIAMLLAQFILDLRGQGKAKVSLVAHIESILSLVCFDLAIFGETLEHLLELHIATQAATVQMIEYLCRLILIMNLMSGV